MSFLLVLGIELRVLCMQGSFLPLKPLLLFIRLELPFSDRKHKNKTKYLESHKLIGHQVWSMQTILSKPSYCYLSKHTSVWLVCPVFIVWRQKSSILLMSSLIMSSQSLPMKRRLSLHTDVSITRSISTHSSGFSGIVETFCLLSVKENVSISLPCYLPSSIALSIAFQY